MSRRMFRSVVLIVLAFSLVTGACFQIKLFKMTPQALSPGATGTIRLDLHRLSGNEQNTDGYTFILIGYEHTKVKLNAVGRFDVFGNFDGPFTRMKDGALRNHLRTAGNCVANGIDASSITDMTRWRAYRTTAPMDSTAGGMDEPFMIKLKFQRLFADNKSRADFVIFSGTWADLDDNGVVSGGDATVCASMVFASWAGKP